jgi:hypothetical protein
MVFNKLSPKPLVAFGLLILITLNSGCHNKQKSEAEKDGYFISTASESDERVKKLGLDKASEDASYILDTNKLSIPKKDNRLDTGKYKADPEREWIIDVRFTDGTTFTKTSLDSFLIRNGERNTYQLFMAIL